jgi:hypothetical protein
MGNTDKSHAVRRQLILSEIERRACVGEALSVRAIAAATGGSHRTITAVLNTYRESNEIRFLDGRAARSQDEREMALRERLQAALLRTADIEVELVRTVARLNAANELIASQRDSLERFEKHLPPVWREMMERLDMLRHLRVDDLANTLAELKAKAAGNADVGPVMDRDSRIALLEAKNQKLVQQVVRLTEKNTELARRLDDADVA